MITYKDLAGQLLLEPFTIQKTKDQQDKIRVLAEEIYSDESTSRDRSFENVFQSCEATALEYWVAENTDFEMNLSQFDKSDPTTYAYDLINQSGQTLEVKTCIKFDNQWWNIRSFSFVKTMVAYSDMIDFVYAAEFIRQEESYLVKPKLLLKGEHIKHVTKSKKGYGWGYYNHKAVIDELEFKGPLA